eukprot:COSAG03_NODE_509_length_7307_cov_21.200333_3_plen_125_part_00
MRAERAPELSELQNQREKALLSGKDKSQYIKLNQQVKQAKAQQQQGAEPASNAEPQFPVPEEFDGKPPELDSLDRELRMGDLVLERLERHLGRWRDSACACGAGWCRWRVCGGADGATDRRGGS